MERTRKVILTQLLLSTAGLLFSGYLSATKLFTGTCAFNEPCPYFLGYPACWYGFVMFATLFGVSLAAYLRKMPVRKAGQWLTAVSGLGILFAGSFVVQEVYGWLSVGRFMGYGLGLPTCVYGLAFYIIIFVIALAGMMRRTEARADAPPMAPPAE